MTEKLKYKVGDKVLIEGKIDHLDTTDSSYRFETEDGGFAVWVFEEYLKVLQKPKIPQAVMDWYEHHKRSHWNVRNYFMHTPEEIDDWFSVDLQNEHAFVTLITYGPQAVEVEKEKLYKVKVKNLATGYNYLIKNEGVGHLILGNDRPLVGYTFKFTKQELIEAGFEGVFDNPMFEVEEVE
ncbi:DUF1642 domain-containing protein [Streptococcus sp. NLN76]|uniref:DUF1642 domain-containing protein n=1 Tax=Streptococcus sp. NLN76 TaxID=2822800 RepID=UPI0018AA27D1|nr:DUF1642 domain-containing protein [Streptococcus sp. NLN76]MBF8970174.1 DUF1642 domain-containing protein [Streptococcus sp. NLN76]